MNIPRGASGRDIRVHFGGPVERGRGFVLHSPDYRAKYAEFLKIDPSQVLDTASFYEEYWLKPKGKRLVAVCRSIACSAFRWNMCCE